MPEVNNAKRTRMAIKIQEAREDILKLSQREFAVRLGVSQSNVSKWESDQLKPESQHLMKLARFLERRPESLFFMEAAGVPAGYFYGETPFEGSAAMPSDFSLASVPTAPMYHVPLLRNSAAAGTPRMVEESEIETWIPVLRSWMPRGSALVAMRISGDSMSPLIQEGFVVLVDTAQKDPRKLVGGMVCARNGDGVTIKWLRKDSGMYMLVPQNLQSRFPITVLKEEDGWGIVGAVVQWIGTPKPKK